jgi:hypothetical protein
MFFCQAKSGIFLKSLIFMGIDMKFSIDNLPTVSKELVQSQLRATDDLTKQSLNYFDELFRLNCTAAKNSSISYLSLISKVSQAANFEKSGEVMFGHAKPAVENMANHINNVAIVCGNNLDTFLKFSDNRFDEMIENIDFLAEDAIEVGPNGFDPYVEIFRANVSICEVAYKKISKANDVLSNTARSQFEFYANKLSSITEEKSTAVAEYPIKVNDVDYSADTEGGGID